MAGSLNRHLGATARGATISTITIAGIGAAVAMTVAVPMGASAAPSNRSASSHQSGSTHHGAAKRHGKHIMVNGVIAGHHGREMTVFAKTAKVGGHTRHNERLELRFDRDARENGKVRTGDRVHLTATGTASGRHFRIARDHDETVTAEAATLFFGTVTAVNGDLLTVAEHDRDNGSRDDGDDNGHGQDGGGDGQPADHSPGGPGNGNNNSGHQIVIDDTAASITVDGEAGTVAVGDTVAALGEATDNTVMASTVWTFATPPALLRGDITAISGDNVTIGDNDDHDNGVARDHGGDNPVTVSLTGVPLALNGDSGATTSQLVVGEMLLVIGSVDSTTNAFTPTLAFAFNDRDRNQCGDNDGHAGSDS